MPDAYVSRDVFIRKHGEVAYLDRCAALAAKKRRARNKARLRQMGDDAPLDPALVRNVLNGHPPRCLCVDCLFPPVERETRIAKWPERIRL